MRRVLAIDNGNKSTRISGSIGQISKRDEKRENRLPDLARVQSRERLRRANGLELFSVASIYSMFRDGAHLRERFLLILPRFSTTAVQFSLMNPRDVSWN